VTVDPTGQYIYVGNRQGSNVTGYGIDRTAGALHELDASPFRTRAFPAAVAVDSTAQFAYVPNSFDNNVAAYAIDADTGALTELGSSPFPAGTFPVAATTTAGPQPQAPPATRRARR
jgi:6-phosphogluconolactonase (cycloisomerase 2 family)